MLDDNKISKQVALSTILLVELQLSTVVGQTLFQQFFCFA